MATEAPPDPVGHRAARAVPQFTDQRLEEMLLDLIASGTNSTRALLQTVCCHVDARYRQAHAAKLGRSGNGFGPYAKASVLDKTERRWKKRILSALRKHCRFARIRAVGYDQWEIL